MKEALRHQQSRAVWCCNIRPSIWEPENGTRSCGARLGQSIEDRLSASSISWSMLGICWCWNTSLSCSCCNTVRLAGTRRHPSTYFESPPTRVCLVTAGEAVARLVCRVRGERDVCRGIIVRRAVHCDWDGALTSDTPDHRTRISRALSEQGEDPASAQDSTRPRRMARSTSPSPRTTAPAHNARDQIQHLVSPTSRSMIRMSLEVA